MPASFGFCVMFIVLYLFGSKTGCHALNWLQKVFFGKKRDAIVALHVEGIIAYIQEYEARPVK